LDVDFLESVEGLSHCLCHALYFKMKYMLHHFRDENLKVIDDFWSVSNEREQYYSATIYDREQYTLEIISFNLVKFETGRLK